MSFRTRIQQAILDYLSITTRIKSYICPINVLRGRSVIKSNVRSSQGPFSRASVQSSLYRLYRRSFALSYIQQLFTQSLTYFLISSQQNDRYNSSRVRLKLKQPARGSLQHQRRAARRTRPVGTYSFRSQKRNSPYIAYLQVYSGGSGLFIASSTIDAIGLCFRLSRIILISGESNNSSIRVLAIMYVLLQQVLASYRQQVITTIIDRTGLDSAVIPSDRPSQCRRVSNVGALSLSLIYRPEQSLSSKSRRLLTPSAAALSDPGLYVIRKSTFNSYSTYLTYLRLSCLVIINYFRL